MKSTIAAFSLANLTWGQRAIHLFIICLAFLAGVQTSPVLLRYLDKTQVPPGTWVSLFTSTAISLQINTSTIQSTPGIITVWMREDHPSTVLSSTGAMGHTFITNITVDCLSDLVVLNEQRSFNKLMTHLSTTRGNGLATLPADPSSILLTALLCQPSKTQAPPSLL